MSLLDYLSNKSPSSRTTLSSSISRPMTTSSAAPVKSRVLAALDADLADFETIDIEKFLPISQLKDRSDSGQESRNVKTNAIFGKTSVHNSTQETPALPAETGPVKPRSKKIRKEENPLNLPHYSYKDFTPRPSRVYIRHEEEANIMLASLKGPLGFDLEWRVTCYKGGRSVTNKTALAQVCDHETILLIQLSAMGRFPAKLREILESPEIIKLGVNILNDGKKLYNDFRIIPRGLVELGALARQADSSFPYSRNIVALATMTECYTKKYLYKGPVRYSNWENKLSESQLEYAANDAHCALMVYDKLIAIAKEANVELVPEKYTNAVSAAPLSGIAVSSSTNASTIAKPIPLSVTAASSSSTKEFISPPVIARTNTSTSISTTSSVASKSTSADSIPLCDASSATSKLDTHINADQVVPTPPVRQRPQHIRAYCLWYYNNMPLDEMCKTLSLRSREDPLKEGTVISYIVGALQADMTLPYSYTKLVDLVKMEKGSWFRHKEWVEKQAPLSYA